MIRITRPSSDLTANETVDLLLLALNLPIDYEGEVILHFGQKMGLRNPQIPRSELKKKLVPALIELCKPAMFEAGDGGKVKIYILEGRFGYLVPLDNHLEDIPAYRNQVERWNSYLFNDAYKLNNKGSTIRELWTSLNSCREVWDYSVNRKNKYAAVRIKSHPLKLIR